MRDLGEFSPQVESSRTLRCLLPQEVRRGPESLALALTVQDSDGEVALKNPIADVIEC